ncbi:M15 family metallopeptidase [Rhizobium sp. TH2]|uniref:M15 family metallopeptidase n=1 Tax=Rhizobium sp. TH2 TaxID=2775403 RepID=UPI002157B360|nr:M15 family metallopeptidase [Rhizobium sp. TH2]
MPMMCRALAFACGLMLAVQAVTVQAAELPSGFVYLSDVDAAIVQDMRYAGPDNFTHAPAPGYNAAECILTMKAAKVLAQVQKDLRSSRLGLKVWDCYRPVKAVDSFVAWAGKGADFDKIHYPRVSRDRLIAEGYIGKRSGHSAGSTIDLTLVSLDGSEIDMGTGFDFFDPLAHTNSAGVSRIAKANRKLLVEAMQRRGFKNYAREWWHFSLDRQPFAGRRFDFDILPRGK